MHSARIFALHVWSLFNGSLRISHMCLDAYLPFSAWLRVPKAINN